MPEEKSFRGIVRIAGTDVDGKAVVPRALTCIKGVGVSLAHSITTVLERKASIPKSTRVGDLTDEQLRAVETVIKNLSAYGIPEWQLCCQKDRTTGVSTHLTGAELDFKKRQDIEFKKKQRTYQGVRHAYGLPVRGGCTRTRGRTGLTLGVVKKKAMPARAGEKREKKERK